MKKGVLIIIIGVITLSLISTYTLLKNILPKKPEIKHGEFSFCLKYEINGNIYEVHDTLVCDYDGYAANTARGFYRCWKSHLKSGKTRITLYNDDIEIFFTPNINHWVAGAVFMGDNEIYDEVSIPFPDAWYTTNFENKQVNSYIISAEEMWNKYKIKLLSWEIESPIRNTFK